MLVTALCIWAQPRGTEPLLPLVKRKSLTVHFIITAFPIYFPPYAKQGEVWQKTARASTVQQRRICLPAISKENKNLLSYNRPVRESQKYTPWRVFFSQDSSNHMFMGRMGTLKITPSSIINMQTHNKQPDAILTSLQKYHNIIFRQYTAPDYANNRP